jgi:hypothetical protein
MFRDQRPSDSQQEQLVQSVLDSAIQHDIVKTETAPELQQKVLTTGLYKLRHKAKKMQHVLQLMTKKTKPANSSKSTSKVTIVIPSEEDMPSAPEEDDDQDIQAGGQIPSLQDWSVDLLTDVEPKPYLSDFHDIQDEQRKDAQEGLHDNDVHMNHIGNLALVGESVHSVIQKPEHSVLAVLRAVGAVQSAGMIDDPAIHQPNVGVLGNFRRLQPQQKARDEFAAAIPALSPWKR